MTINHVLSVKSESQSKNSNERQFVSFVILTFNSYTFLKRCLDSVLSQKYENYQIIIIDGGSKDGTLDILQEYSKVYSGFHYYTYPDTNIGEAREIGTSFASGDICAYIDSDCELPSPNWLSTMMKGFDSPVIACVWTFGSFHPTDPSLMRYSILSNPFRGKVPDLITKNNYIPVGTGHTLIRKDIIQEIGGFRDIHAAEDIDLTYEIVKRGYAIRYMRGNEVFHYHVTSLKQWINKNRRNISGGLHSDIWKRTYLSSGNLETLFNITLVYPMLFAGYKMYLDRDTAWLWHPFIIICKFLIAGSTIIGHRLRSH